MCQQISKEAFYRNGGFSNPRQYRRMIDGRWRYFKKD